MRGAAGTRSVNFRQWQREEQQFLDRRISETDYNVAQASYVPCPTPTSSRSLRFRLRFTTQQGRNGGGNVNAILKSGTRELPKMPTNIFAMTF